MTPEFITALAAIIAIAISFRTASHTELRSLFDTLRNDFEKYKKDAESKEERYQNRIEGLERQVDNYERWMTAALAEIRRLGGTPPPWEDKQ